MESSPTGAARLTVDRGGRASFNQILFDEVCALRPALLQGFEPAGFPKDSQELDQRPGNLRELYKKISTLSPAIPPGREGKEGDTDQADPARAPLSALCLSGGGIRSATFNLGVIQRLARVGLLGKFDYLSSVSGGGYIASWLRAWMDREGMGTVVEQLGGRGGAVNPLAPEPKPLDSLREYSNYLTPRLGLLSGDTWTAAAIVVRNLILNWLVIVPLLGAVIAVPQFLLLMTNTEGFARPWGVVFLGIALLIELIASIAVYWFRRFVKKPWTPHGRFLAWCVFPVVLAAAALSSAVLGLELPWKVPRSDATEEQSRMLLGFALLWCIVVPTVGWAVSEVRAQWQARGVKGLRVTAWIELVALILSGVIAAGLLVLMTMSWLPHLYERPALFVILGLPLLLGLYLIARTLFVAIASLGDSSGRVRVGASDDADREWWARMSGWILLVGVAWVAVTGLCLLGGHLLQVFADRYLTGIVAAMGGVAGIVAALLGGRGTAGDDGQAGRGAPRIRKWALGVAAPLFAISAVILIGLLTVQLGESVTGNDCLFALPDNLRRGAPVPMRDAYIFLVVPLGLVLLTFLAGFVVKVNRFSLHGMYRNRLVRAYLGASNRQRQPDPFTGFDPADNPRLCDLWHAERATRPLPLINVTLNLVRSGGKLAWQQRKAESFSMTPFYCGNFYEGYRRSDEYGGPQGISLGTAVSISGAAANPNMGYASSPVMGFLLALFNARLGAWLGNTNLHGQNTYPRSGPKHAVRPMLTELFGLTTAESSYVNLSDGGHFDNLGLYEVVLRRCRHVLVSDAGQDRSFGFEDLGNAIRKIRIDFGIPIEFTARIAILPRDDGESPSSEPQGLYCATAVIRYSAVDGTDAENDGRLVYIKPTLRGAGQSIPYDVYSYARASDAFPHEPTSDQWFSESQFESYRALGWHVLGQVCGDNPLNNFRDFLARVDSYVGGA